MYYLRSAKFLNFSFDQSLKVCTYFSKSFQLLGTVSPLPGLWTPLGDFRTQTTWLTLSSSPPLAYSSDATSK